MEIKNAKLTEAVLDSEFLLHWENGQETAVVSVSGEIDLADLNEFRAILDRAAAAETAVIVDLSAVSYMDSSGFNALLETSRITRSLGIAIYLAGCQPGILRLLEVTRLNTLFTLKPDLNTALGDAAQIISTAAALSA